MRKLLAVGMVIGFAIVIRLVASRIAAHRIANEDLATECIGGGSRHVVYLHGIDAFGPSWQELRNRRTLARLAAEFDLTIAVPRSGSPCWNSSSSRCWSPDEVVGLIHDAASRCFDSTSNVGAIGFSNGGFALGAAFHRCAAKHLAWVAIAGGGGVVGDDTAGDLSECGTLALAIGTNDRHHHAIATRFADDVRARGARVHLVEFDGGHRLDFDVMRDLLAKLVEHR